MNSHTPHWRVPPDGLVVLRPGQVHFWRVSLNSGQALLDQLRATLSPDELSRAERFRFPKDRLRFIAARGILRHILSRYTGRPASLLVFGYGPAGKPFLLNENGDPAEVEFNLAHSHGNALYGFALNSPLGVDLEQVRPEVPVEKLAARFFAPGESQTLLGLPETDRRLAFFLAWTRKEAFLKALGFGIRAGLAACRVSLEPGSQDALLSFRGDTQVNSRWRLADLSLHPDYAAAVAVERRLTELCFWDWRPPAIPS